ncbi:MAG: response regulator, partial [Duncaniella sp.]|nr:response regulator [Duncaniella sp.]
MKLRTLIIDDEPIALEKLGKYVEKVPFLELVGTCESALDASAVLADVPVDLIFTDINMPDLNGMDF